MPVPLLSIGPAPLSVDPLTRAVIGSTGPEGHVGGVVVFLGLVRNHNADRQVLYLEYEAYEALALKAFERIVVELGTRWPGVRAGVHHRIGRVEIGEASIVIVTASAHRADAFQSCRYVIERVKQ